MKYRLEISEEQARLLRNACEFYSRVGMGQFDRLLDEFDRPWTGEEKELCDRLHVLLTGLPPNAHSGINGAEERFRVAWDFVQVIRKQLYDDFGGVPRGFAPVDSDPPRRYSETQELARIERLRQGASSSEPSASAGHGMPSDNSLSKTVSRKARR